MTFFKPSGQWSVRVAFQASQHDALVTNFTQTDTVVHSVTGSPVMDVGNVQLQPKL